MMSCAAVEKQRNDHGLEAISCEIILHPPRYDHQMLLLRDLSVNASKLHGSGNFINRKLLFISHFIIIC